MGSSPARTNASAPVALQRAAAGFHHLAHVGGGGQLPAQRCSAVAWALAARNNSTWMRRR